MGRGSWLRGGREGGASGGLNWLWGGGEGWWFVRGGGDGFVLDGGGWGLSGWSFPCGGEEVVRRCSSSKTS